MLIRSIGRTQLCKSIFLQALLQQSFELVIDCSSLSSQSF